MSKVTFEQSLVPVISKKKKKNTARWKETFVF